MWRVTLPPSFKAAGFGKVPPRRKVRLPNGKLLKPLMIGTQGMTNSGKSEFIMSCPGPGIVIAIDRNYDGIMDNPNPPATRHDNFVWHPILIPMNTGSPVGPGSAQKSIYEQGFLEVRSALYKALDIPDCLTVAVDCDSDMWELHRLSMFGKLTGIYPATKYSPAYAEKRFQISKCFDSGKIIIGTNKVKDEYETIYKPDGTPELDKENAEIRRKTGRKERQGFPDTDYLWEVQLEHLVKDAVGKTPMQWGIKILKCKSNPQLKGEELWGEDCCFSTLVQVIYPDMDLSEWGL